MKLYYSTGSCSLAADIALHESGLKFDREKVDLQTKITETGANYRDVNPKGSVIRWTDLEMTKIDLSKCPVLADYKKRVEARPAVHAAMVAQGIIKS